MRNCGYAPINGTDYTYALRYNAQDHDPVNATHQATIQPGEFANIGFDIPVDDDAKNTEYDAAKAILGDGWMIPTAEQQGELAHTCELYYEEIDNHPCIRCVGPNGNSIVLPLAGRKQASPDVQEVGSLGMYWSSSIFRMNPEGAYIMWCRQSSEDPTRGGCDAGTGSGEHYFVATPRCSGLSIRPIYVK